MAVKKLNLATVFIVTNLGLSVNLYASEVYLQFNTKKIDKKSELPVCLKNSIENCKANIEDAFQLINQTDFKNNILKNNINLLTVVFEPQQYRLTQPIEIRWNIATRLVLQGQQAQKNSTILTGAQPIVFDKIAKNDPLLKALSPEIKANLKVATVPKTFSFQENGFGKPIHPTLGELFWQNQVQPIAQWPNKSFSTLKINTPKAQAKFTIEDFNPKQLQTDDLYAQGYWFWDWANQSYRVNYLGNGQFENKNGDMMYGIKDKQRVVLKNSISLLDAPGEWYVNRKDQKLYFWSPNKKINDAEWSVLETLLKIESSKNISINDIAFTKTRANAIMVNNSHQVIFKNINVQYTGNRGLVIQGGKNSGVLDSHFENTGEGSISITGGNRNKLEAAGHFVKNSTFKYFDRLVPTYRPAISLNGVGNIIEGNTISEGAHAAIIFMGNDHRIANNKISKVALETSDVGAIYTGRDYTARGTIIENNTIEDIQPFREDGSVIGVYLDDQASGITIRNNTFNRVQKGILMGGGRDNIISNNKFTKNNIAISYDSRGTTWQKQQTLDEKWQLKQGLKSVPYQNALWTKKYPNLANILKDDYGQAKYNRIIGNQFIENQQSIFFSGITKEKSGAEIKN